MNDITIRLNRLLEHLKLNQRRFAISIGVSPQTINNYFKGSSEPGFELLKNIAVNYPEINTHWLLTGEGDIIKEEYSGNNITVNKSELLSIKEYNQENNSVKNMVVNEEMAEYRKKDQEKDEIIKLLKERIEDLKETIEILKKKN